MYKTIRVPLNERVVIFRNGLPREALGPGQHTVWGLRLMEQRFKTDQLLFEALPEVRAVLPQDWYSEIALDKRQRGVLYKDGKPKRFLRPGQYRFWTVDPSVKLEVFDVDQPMPEITDELRALLPRAEFIEATVLPYQRGLKYVQGRLEETLEPGQYAFWTHPRAQVHVGVIDLRRAQLAIAGQELMTRDKVTLRLTLTVEYSVVDPALAAHAVTDLRDAIYTYVQLAARQYLAGTTLDELLEGREQMTTVLEAQVVPQAEQLGVRIERVGVKDIVLPGEMKTLLNRVIEAEKEAAANVILRREETAATRSLANTARVMADQPVLLRLKELDAMKEIASQIGEVRIVVGADGLKTLLPAELLGDRKNGHV